MPQIGLVTVLYNSDDLLEDFFKSLSLQEFKDYHLYLIDNSEGNSAVQRIAELREIYPIADLSYLKNEYNAGIAKGYNQGICLSIEAGTEFTIVLNNDIEFMDPLLLDKLLKTAHHRREHIVVPKIYIHGTSKLWCAGGDLSVWKGRTWHHGEGKEDSPEFSIPGFTAFSPGCFIFINNKVFEETGLMNEDYFVYYEDTDFLFRALKKGFRIWYDPEIKIYHKVSSITGGNDSLFSIYYMERNRIYFILKNLNWKNRIIAFPYTLYQMASKFRYYNVKQMRMYFSGIIAGFKRPVRNAPITIIALNCLLIFL